MGMEKALEALRTASEKGLGIQLKRMGKIFGFDLTDGIPSPLLALDDSDLDSLLDAVAANWLANDGVWFQAVEFTAGMNDAKRCNDSCWPISRRWRRGPSADFLNLAPDCGLQGLKQALNFRLYGKINTQSFVDEGPDRFVFRMDQCRVQAARKAQGA